ncbi:MAG: hypothetical protein PHE17_18075 [Thiothrix sp.]|uniref:hypothetical protein n=1 Tax=Thiothrix sp. TaxID=1032 RepID=UPI0026215CAF|nr:hypothetical protein [Thiothrix sp.]MDD5394929.1 hypothetical protein [Thiothrix sp.]
MDNATATPQTAVEFANELKGLTVEDFDARIGTDPALALKVSDTLDSKTIDEIAEAQKKNSLDRAAGRTPPAAPGTPAQPGTEDAEEEVHIKLRRKDLGDYAPKDRTMADAIREMVKGYPIKDQTIKILKDHQLPSLRQTIEASSVRTKALEEDNARLKAELEKRAAQPQPPAQPVAEEIVIPKRPENYDPFNEEHQKIMAARDEAFEKILTAKKEAAQPQPPAPPATPQSAPRQEIDQAVQNEFNEIRMLQVNPQFANQLLTKTDIETLNAQYSDFVEKLAGLCGIRDIYTTSGNLTKPVNDVVLSYFNPSDTTGMKARAEQANVKPPEEMDALRRIYLVKECTRVRKDGKFVEIPYDVAATIAKSRYPEFFNDANPLQQAVSDRQKFEAALDQRRGKAVEVPAGQGAGQMDDDQLATQALEIMNRKSYAEMTDGEVEILKQAMRKEHYSEEEIKQIIPPRKPK